jgi:hypothetical protein
VARVSQGSSYRRIVCFPEGPDKGKINNERLDPLVVQHCQEIQGLRRANPGRISIKKATTVFDHDFMLIGKKIAVMIISTRDAKTGRDNRMGFLIFHNPPNARIISELYDVFQRVENSSTTHGVDAVPEVVDGNP